MRHAGNGEGEEDHADGRHTQRGVDQRDRHRADTELFLREAEDKRRHDAGAVADRWHDRAGKVLDQPDAEDEGGAAQQRPVGCHGFRIEKRRHEGHAEHHGYEDRNAADARNHTLVHLVVAVLRPITGQSEMPTTPKDEAPGQRGAAKNDDKEMGDHAL